MFYGSITYVIPRTSEIMFPIAAAAMVVMPKSAPNVISIYSPYGI